MMHIKKWNPFLNENVQNAKSFLIKREREKILKENPGKSFREIQLTPEQEEKALQDPEFLDIKDFLVKKNKPGLTYAWVYFLKEDPKLPFGVVTDIPPQNIEDITQITAINLYYLYVYWDSIKGNSKLKRGTPDGYVAAKENGQLEDTAWNTLWDELQDLLQEKQVDKFIENFPRNIREYYRVILNSKDTDQRSKKIYDKLLNYVASLLKCPILPGKIEVKDRDTGNVIHRYPNQAKYHIIKVAGKWGDFESYPEFRDPFTAFVDLLSDMKGQIDSSGKPLSKSIVEIENLEPQVKILYRSDNPPMMLTSSRSFLGITKVCSLSNTKYCISDLNNFYQPKYHECLLISINQFSKDPSEADYLLTFHVNKKLDVIEWSNTQNKKLDNKGRTVQSTGSLTKFLDIFKVPNKENIIQSIKENFLTEITLKKSLEFLYKEIGVWDKENYLTVRKVLSVLGRIDIKQTIDNKSFSPEVIDTITSTVMEIIKEEFEYTRKDIIDYYTSVGLYTIKDFSILKEFIGNNIDKEMIRELLINSHKKLVALEYSRLFNKTTTDTKKISVLLSKSEELKQLMRKEYGLEY
jgi:hypothetical protein